MDFCHGRVSVTNFELLKNHYTHVPIYCDIYAIFFLSHNFHRFIIIYTRWKNIRDILLFVLYSDAVMYFMCGRVIKIILKNIFV